MLRETGETLRVVVSELVDADTEEDLAHKPGGNAADPPGGERLRLAVRRHVRRFQHAAERAHENARSERKSSAGSEG